MRSRELLVQVKKAIIRLKTHKINHQLKYEGAKQACDSGHIIFSLRPML